MITKEEALELLNISANAGKEEISSAYKQLFSDYQIRLTNAPTPHLKTLYQNNLKKLEEALKLLLPEGIGAGSDDLPSDTPTLQTNSGGNIQKTALTQTTTGSTKTAQSKNLIPEKKNSVLLPILGLATVIAVAAAVFIFIQYGGMYNGKMNEVITLKKERDELKKTVANFAPILKNGSMKISNNFNSDIIVGWWSVTYRDKEGNIKKFDSFSDGNTMDAGKFHFPSYNIKPGQSIEMQYVSGNAVIWDGSVITYSLLVQDSSKPGLFYLFSGIWNDDAKEGKLFISKPKYAN
jgi:hypothetical protein